MQTFGEKWSIPIFSIIVSCCVGVANAQDWSGMPEQLIEKIEAAEQACFEFEKGQFTLEFGAVHRVDLDGDIRRDWVLDEAGFSCSSAASLFCGSGGCMSHFLVDKRTFSLLNQGWEMVNIGPFRVLLADVHGSQCGGINSTPCIASSVWDAEEQVWQSTNADWQ